MIPHFGHMHSCEVPASSRCLPLPPPPPPPRPPPHGPMPRPVPGPLPWGPVPSPLGITLSSRYRTGIASRSVHTQNHHRCGQRTERSTVIYENFCTTLQSCPDQFERSSHHRHPERMPASRSREGPSLIPDSAPSPGSYGGRLSCKGYSSPFAAPASSSSMRFFTPSRLSLRNAACSRRPSSSYSGAAPAVPYAYGP